MDNSVPVMPVRNMTSKPRNKKKWVKMAIYLVILLAVAAAGFLGFKYTEAQKEVKRLSNPQEAAREEVASLKAEVAKLVELPSDETPTVATVVDPEKLKSQAFFAKAQAGDKVLIFTQARKAILYRPSSNKVIEIAPINLGNNQQSTDQTQTNP